jgi:hypothetical protein
MPGELPINEVPKNSRELPLGRYRHYKGKEYTVIGLALHSETQEELVVYRQEYGEHGLWVRPKQMFQELVNVGGQMVPRFQYLGNSTTYKKETTPTPQQAWQRLQDSSRGLQAGKVTSPIKNSRKPSDVYTLKLSQQQRYTLVHCTRLSRGLKNKMQLAGEGVQVIDVSRKELDHLYNETAQAAVYVASADKRRLMAVQRMVIKFFEEEQSKSLGSASLS